MPYPALLKTTSTPPAANAFAAARSIWSGSVMSSGIRTTAGEEARSVSLSGLRMVAITRQPLDANNLAAALPSPDELPVMKMVLAC